MPTKSISVPSRVNNLLGPDQISIAAGRLLHGSRLRGLWRLATGMNWSSGAAYREALAVLAFVRELLDWTDTERSCQEGADIVRLLGRPRKSPTSYEVEPA